MTGPLVLALLCTPLLVLTPDPASVAAAATSGAAGAASTDRPGTAIEAAAGIASPTPAPSSLVCRFTDARLTEISGLVPSVRHPGILWVHNDSGDGPVLYGVDAKTCKTRAVLRLRRVQARDIEAAAIGVGPSGAAALWVADVGDNRDSWPYVTLYRSPEPARLGPSDVPAVPLRFTYADGAHNAETLLADPQQERLWLVSKQLAAGRLWSLPTTVESGSVAVAQPLQDMPALATDGAVSADGSRVVVRDYLDAWVYAGLPPGRLLARIELPFQPQGEAVAWTPDGRGLHVAGERDDRLLRVELPTVAWTDTALAATPSPGVPTAPPTNPAAQSAPTPGPGSSTAGTDAAALVTTNGSASDWWRAIAAVLASALLLGGLALLRRRRTARSGQPGELTP